MLPDSFNGWKPYDMSKFWGVWVLIAGVSIYFCVDSEKYKLDHAWDKDERPFNQKHELDHLFDDKLRAAIQKTRLYVPGTRSEIHQTQLRHARELITESEQENIDKWMNEQIDSEKITPEEIFSWYQSPTHKQN